MKTKISARYSPLPFRFLLVSLVLLSLAVTQTYAHAGKHEEQSEALIFGVVPQQSSAKLIRDWSPLLKSISELSGLKIRFATAPNIPEFEKRLATGEYDIAYMNPYHFTVFNESPGYNAIAHAKNKRIKGIMVVNKNSGITSIEQLEGTNIAFPAPAAFAATLLTQAILKNQGIRYTPHYVGSHDSAYLGVSDGLFEAGGGVLRTLGAALPQAKQNLNVLFTTEGYTPHAIASHPAMPEKTRLKIQKALTSLTSHESGIQALKALNISSFQSANNQDWDDVRKLNIAVLEEYQ